MLLFKRHLAAEAGVLAMLASSAERCHATLSLIPHDRRFQHHCDLGQDHNRPLYDQHHGHSIAGVELKMPASPAISGNDSGVKPVKTRR
jgi:hypothetical protein